MQTCGADPRGVRVEWHDGGGRARLVGVTELRWMKGTNPNVPLSVLEGLGRSEAGRSAGGMDPQHKGWALLQDRAEETSSSSSSSSTTTTTTTTTGGRTPPCPSPPPNAPKKTPRHFESSDEEPPPPSQAQ